MKAARVHQFGPPDVIAIEETPIPSPDAGEVLVRVHAAGVGPWDTWIRSGKSALPQPLPLTLGSDISGVVERVGRDVAGFQAGDAVFGVTNPRFTNGYAEYALAAAGMIAAKPRALSDIEAASVPVIAVTAWQMLVDHADATAGQSVFIHGGAGNVGAYAVQLARLDRLQVTASARAGDAKDIRALGAGEVVEFPSPRASELAGRFDAVIDTVGGDTQDALFGLLKPGGILVSAVSPPDAERARAAGVRAKFFIVEVTTARLAQIADLFETGRLKTQVGQVFALRDARRVHELIESRVPRPRGKIVLEVPG